MPFLSPAVAEAARVVVRQATETALTSALSPSSATISSATSPTVSSRVSTSISATPTSSSTLANGGANSGGGNSGNGGGGGNGDEGGGGGNNSSSLLFFVALGFGVVFTNLWIIVGVKYCFRYNARARQLRNEEGEPINMENMPRPHRRRREKKLMPIDEVNEKFPMLKYKTWVASRAQEGLPTRGGVSSPQSRANSIRDADGVVQEFPPKERTSTDERPTTSATATRPATEPGSDAAPEIAEKHEPQGPRHVPKESTSSTVAGLRRASTESNREPENTVAQKHMSQMSHEEEEEDERIDAALPPECLGTSGDTCAICIDTLEDDDDVRGLTCGHAFHAVCIDPWLTTRRACCPLCKADYYTPKPRPPAAEPGDGTMGVIHVTIPTNTRNNNSNNNSNNNNNHRMNLPGRPRPAFFSFGRLDRPTASRSRPRDTGGSSNPSRQRARPSPEASSPGQIGMGGLLSSLRSAMPTFRFGRGQSSSNPSVSGTATTTPSQLEAGVRNTQS